MLHSPSLSWELGSTSASHTSGELRKGTYTYLTFALWSKTAANLWLDPFWLEVERDHSTLLWRANAAIDHKATDLRNNDALDACDEC